MTVRKTEGELELMDEANVIVHRVLNGIAERIGVGVTTRELDRWAEDLIRSLGGVPAFLHYKGFPATLCTALNDVIVHGIPDEQPLVYKFHHKNSGRQLLDSQTLGEAGVQSGDILRLQPEITAGSAG